MRGAATPAGSPYGPVVGALREYLRVDPRRPRRLRAAAHPPRRCSSPSSARRAPSGDRATLVEAIRCGLATLVAERPGGAAARRPAVVRRGHDRAARGARAAAAPSCRCWSSRPTAPTSCPRTHPLRRLRHDLRRDRALARARAGARSTRRETGELIAAARRAPTPSPRLTRLLHDRTGGVPFFVEELTAALHAGRPPDARRRRAGADARRRRRRCPQTVRDAVLVRLAPLSDSGRAAAEAAAVAGARLDLDLVAGAGRRGRRSPSCWPAGCSSRPTAGARPRSATRSCATRSTTTCRGCAAARCTARSPTRCARAAATPARSPAHWLAARDPARALEALLEAIADRAAVHAYRDATRLGRQALEIWPEGEQRARAPGRRRAATPATPSWPATSARRPGRSARSSPRAAPRAPAARSPTPSAGSPAIYALQGDRRPRARRPPRRRRGLRGQRAAGRGGGRAARRSPATCRAPGRHDEAAATARPRPARRRVRAERAGPARAGDGPRGRRARQGRRASTRASATIRAGLSLALEHELTPVAAEVYQRLGTAHEVAGDYGGARDALGTALGLCERPGRRRWSTSA